MKNNLYKNETKFISEHYAGHCLDEEVLKNSSSGGMFTAFARKIFELDGYVFGAVFDSENYEICHIGVQSESDLTALRKSKYVWSNWKKCIPDIEKIIKKDEYILFTGTPCQASAIKKMFGYYEKLFVVDLFCHGTAEPVFLKNYLEMLNLQATAIDFRAQSNINNFNFRIWNDEGIVIDDTYDENLFTSLYVNSAVIRQACFNCSYADKIHQSDLTIGDYNFIETARRMQIDVNHPSIIAVNTGKGQKLLKMVSNSVKLSKIIDKDEINFYYRSHGTFKGPWGYSQEIKQSFMEDYKKYGFVKAAVYSAYSMEMLLVNKLEKVIDEYKGIALYGSGTIARRIMYVIRLFHSEWNITCFITSEKTENKKCDIPTLQIDEALKFLKDQIIVIAVSEKHITQIENELGKREIKNYIK